MSYSRWISSDFYTYWCSSPIPVDREDELFALHATLEETHLFTYAECKQILTDGSKLTERVTDTALTYDMKLLENSLIDLAFLPIGGNYTMDIDDAVIATDFIKSKIVVPIHFNTFDGIEANPLEFKEKVTTSKVVILKPNDSIEI